MKWNVAIHLLTWWMRMHKGPVPGHPSPQLGPLQPQDNSSLDCVFAVPDFWFAAEAGASRHNTVPAKGTAMTLGNSSTRASTPSQHESQSDHTNGKTDLCCIRRQ